MASFTYLLSPLSSLFSLLFFHLTIESLFLYPQFALYLHFILFLLLFFYSLCTTNLIHITFVLPLSHLILSSFALYYLTLSFSVLSFTLFCHFYFVIFPFIFFFFFSLSLSLFLSNYFSIFFLFLSPLLFFLCFFFFLSISLSSSYWFLFSLLFLFSSFTHFLHPTPQLCTRFSSSLLLFFSFSLLLFFEGNGSSGRETAAVLIKVKLKLIVETIQYSTMVVWRSIIPGDIR